MIEPLYTVEMTPISLAPTRSGSRSTSFPTDGRVLESYRGSHIGNFWQGSDGKLHISVYITDGSVDRVVDSDRLDQAIHSIWKEFHASLPWRDKLARRLHAHRAWIAAFLVAVIASSTTLVADRILAAFY